MTTTRRTFLTAFALFAAIPAPALAADRDCGDFKSRRQAQRFFKRNGGPQQDPHNLDADNDGKACESYDYR